MTTPAPPSPSSHALLEGKSVLVTAAAGTGIGFATAKRCAEEGAAVALSDQHEGRLGEAAERLEQVMGARPATAVCDVTDQRQVDSMFEVAIGATGPNQLKAYRRTGMGPCQGRLCGLTVTELMAQARGKSPQEIGYYRLRAPVKPITLAELAAVPKTEDDVKAVVRG